MVHGLCAPGGENVLTPYYEKNGITIYHGDCREILPRIEYADIVLTDPPYGMAWAGGHHDKSKGIKDGTGKPRVVSDEGTLFGVAATRKQKPAYSEKPKERWGAIVGDDALPVETLELAISKARAATYVFCRWDNLVEMPKPTSVIAWVKDNWTLGDLLHSHGRKWEACLFYPGPEHCFIKRIPDVIEAKKTGNEWHPTQKPTDLLMTIINANVGDLILDPYMGSGSTLVAAKSAGRRAIGIEIEERYCQAAVARLDEHLQATITF